MNSRDQDVTAGLLENRVRAAQRARCGDHLCSFSASGQERRRLAGAFVAGALGAGDRIVHVAGDGAAATADRRLTDGGVRVDEPLAGGQVRVLSFSALCGSGGGVDLEAVLARYRAEAESARAAGFPGLRLAVEMAEIVRTLGSVDELVRWEKLVGQVFGQLGITAICDYDGLRFDAAARERIAAEHAATAIDDGTVPSATFIAMASGGGLRVDGELDLATAPRFARALRARAAVSPRVELDLAGVRFADLAGLRTVFEVASELPSDRMLILDRAPAQLRRLLALIGWRDPRVEVRP